MKHAAAPLAVLLLAAGIAQASPSYSVTISDPFANGDACVSGCDVVANGDADRPLFDIQQAVISVSGSTVSVSLSFDFGTNNTNLNPFTDAGINLNVGDLFFTVAGQDVYVAPLASHSGLTAGDLYSIGTNGVDTAQTVLGNPSGVTYRNTATVWGNANDSFVEAGTESLVASGSNGVTVPKFDVTLTFSDAAVAALAADAGNASTFGIFFASATCGNDIISGTGSINNAATPEPMSLGLVGAGLIGALVWGRRKQARA
jgi:hypothetical protein